jgi:hypothetical protein
VISLFDQSAALEAHRRFEHGRVYRPLADVKGSEELEPDDIELEPEPVLPRKPRELPAIDWQAESDALSMPVALMRQAHIESRDERAARLLRWRAMAAEQGIEWQEFRRRAGKRLEYLRGRVCGGTA